MRPPFSITPEILERISEIERLIGRYEGLNQPKPNPSLRRSSKIRTIQGSLAIEGNTLSLEQMTAILEGKRVMGPKSEILEVRNAIAAYDQLVDWRPFVIKDFLKAHSVLMMNLIARPGKWRQGAVGIVKGSELKHIAPPADRVPHLVKELMASLRKNKQIHPLVLGAVMHYELEFIHPFEDGNGRLGRLWHTLFLIRYHDLFSHVPVESVIKDRQADYYAVLAECDDAGESTKFIQFSLDAVRDALDETLMTVASQPVTVERRLELARTRFEDNEFSRKDYLRLFPSLSTATASRDLSRACERSILIRDGDKAKARYRFASGL